MTLAAFCAPGTDCPATWTAAHQPASWSCQGALHVILADCGSVKIATRSGVDTGQKYFYDGSGNLYRVDQFAAGGGEHCLGGSGTAEACNDPNAQNLAICAP